ncbi:WD repeat-containing protein on Y chromosome [Biomphalaria glabrata]|nr:WD repeat-containing protein on Y chromosome [Biomphalaria glabrata]
MCRQVAADMDTADQDENDEEQGEDAFMTIGRHLRKEGGWYRLLRALKKRQIEREKRRAALERKDFSAKYKKKKKRMNMQGLSLVYESAVETLVFLETRRPIDPQTATLIAGGAECWIRFWSLHPKGGLLGQFTSTRRKLESIRCMTTDKNNEYLITGDTMGLLRIWDIKEFCNADKLTPEEREERERRLKKTFVYSRLPFKPEEILDTMEKLREKRISVPDASKPRKNLKSPRLLSSVRCHTQPIVSVELIDERNLILTASQDRTVRLWTKNCTYIGTFGEIWKPIPTVVGAVVEKFPRLPKDIQRCASARSLATLHNGKMPKWRTACYVVRRHIYEQRREKLLEENKAKLKAERSARGEPESEESLANNDRYVSKILGKYYVPRRRYKGPMDLKEQGFPPLVIFKGRVTLIHIFSFQVNSL